jgi:dihydrofolate synthase/folylpolyglutamate synthase
MKKILDYLEELEESRMKFGLERIKKLLSSLNNPHKNYYKLIHVTGTNGKGSVCAFLSYILKEAGYKIGTFTSPHIYSPTERIKINNRPISEDKLAYLLKKLIPIIERMQDKPTYFEVLTALAFLCFKEEKIDIGIIEVGLGGRLDATNVISPSICIITNIDIEHKEFLGSSLTSILKEKAEIIKENTQVISGIKQRHLRDLLKKICKEKKAKSLYQYKEDFYIKDIKLYPSYSSFRLNGETYKIRLLGDFQINNASLAIKSAQILSIPQEYIKTGLYKAKLIARHQLLKLKDEIKLLVDAAHNPAAFKVLFSNLKFYFKDYKWRIIIGFCKDKDIPKMIQIIQQNINFIDYIILTKADINRAVSPGQILQFFTIPCNIRIASNVKEALKIAYEGIDTPSKTLIILTGSFYLLKEIELSNERSFFR